METAKVDIRKLQLLNDRINQTIEALNQVRLSVHGISHTAGLQGQFPQMQQLGGQVPFGGYGGNPYFGAWGGQPQMPGMMPGFNHTTGLGYPGVNPMAGQMNPMFGQINPLLAQLLAAQAQAQQTGFGSGLGHTSGETVDPMRIAQTFPFVQWGYSPFAQQYGQPFGQPYGQQVGQLGQLGIGNF